MHLIEKLKQLGAQLRPARRAARPNSPVNSVLRNRVRVHVVQEIVIVPFTRPSQAPASYLGLYTERSIRN